MKEKKKAKKKSIVLEVQNIKANMEINIKGRKANGEKHS